jgi:hypothetical protein
MSGILGLVLGNFAPAAGGAVTVIQSFTATGEWVCPTGVTEVEWLIVAGGGSGGATVDGAAVVVVALVVLEQATGLCSNRRNTYTITVGAGGSGSASSSPIATQVN